MLSEKTTIKDMGLKPDAFNKLSPAAQKLTKGDLLAMWQAGHPTNAQDVTLEDVKVIKNAFVNQLKPGDVEMMDGDINCCCCPCCCATAVIRPLKATD